MLVTGRFPELEGALAERVRDLRRDDPLGRVTVVVGSGAVRMRVGDLLVRRLGAVANVRVVTLARLARDVAAEAAGAPPVTLAGFGLERLVRRLLRERGSHGLRFFAPVAELPHVAGALAATFADLREALVAPDAGWARAAFGAGDGAAADLEALYADYCAALHERGVADDAGVCLEAAAAAPGVQQLGKVVVYGMYDLNRAQEALVGALLDRGADVFVPVPRGATEEHAAAVLAAAHRSESGTAGGVRPSSRAAGTPVAVRPLRSPRRLPVPPPGGDLDRLSALWDPAASPGVCGRPSIDLRGDGTLRVVSVPDERGEEREAARAVLTAVEGGAPAWDCAVVVPHGEDVARLAGALAGVGLPVACRLPDRSTGPRLCLRLAECLAPRAGEPFARRAVVDLLAAAPLRVPEARCGTVLWLDEARRAGVVCGLDQWLDRLARRRRDLAHRATDLIGRVPGDDGDHLVGRSEWVAQRETAARGLAAAVRTLAEACSGLPERASWTTWADALGSVFAALFSTPAAEAGRDAAGRLRALAVLHEEVDCAEAVAALRELVGAQTVAVGRTGRDGVAVLTPLEVRGLNFHTVVFTGLADGGFPPRGRQDPLLGDAARRRLAEATGTRLPLAEQREDESRVLFAFACEAAREQLILLTPRTEAATGRPRLPSSLLLRLAALASGGQVGLDEFLSGRPLGPVWRHIAGGPPSAPGLLFVGDAVSPGDTARSGDDAGADDTVWVDTAERDTAVLLDLSGNGRRSAALSVLSALLDRPGDPRAAARRHAAWHAAHSPQAGTWDGLLGAQARAALAARRAPEAELHPTRLERFIACPFTYLVRDVLGLEAPAEPGDSLEMDRLEFGTLAHRILQATYRRVVDDGLDLDGALAALGDAWEVACAEAEQRGVTGAAVAWEVTRDTLREDLETVVRQDSVFAAGGGRPELVEWRFGEEAGVPVAVELEGGRVARFAGRVDRVDATPKGLRVIDYKTGSGDAERRSLKEGLSVQLPVYQLAVRRREDAVLGTVTTLFRFVTRRGGFDDLVLAVDEDEAAQRLRDLVGQALALIDAGVFPRTTRGRCDCCDLGYACGVSAWVRARKREHGGFEAVVRLQSPPPGGGRA